MLTFNRMRLMVFALGVITAANCLAEEAPKFVAAKPVWPESRETEMNVLVGFRARITGRAGQPAVLRLAASTIYRAWLNDQFLGHGPARAAHGFYRVDEWDLSGKLRDGENILAIEVASYNVNSFYTLDQPGFLQAEVLSGSKVLACTGPTLQQGGCEAFVLPYRVQKVARYSFQRAFTEVYQMSPQSQAWRAAAPPAMTTVKLAQTPAKKLLGRGALYPQFDLRPAKKLVAEGTVAPIKQDPKKLWKDRSMVNITEKFKGYPEPELAATPSLEIQKLASTFPARPDRVLSPGEKLAVTASATKIVDFGTNFTGFVSATVHCSAKTRLFLAFDEILTEGDVDFARLSCINLISYDLEPGRYRLESIEPYTLRYLKLLCIEGQCDVSDLFLREFSHPPVAAKFSASDPRLNTLFAAGVETFRQNSLDVFMDCPSRERAGWLCDSFFTSRVEADLTGQSPLERNFVQNFLLPEKFAHLPEGMLPMCYPSDHYNGQYIPNWAMWFVVQLEEFFKRSNDAATVAALRPKVLKLLSFLQQYENSDGLLEKLPSWVFVEWSAANKFVQDVNYPSNMLYAGTLSAAGRMYDLPDLLAKAEKVRETIRKQSFDGEFFVDNALRKAGRLEITRNRTETCQYYAFFFDVATRGMHAKLWQTLQESFGPSRAQSKKYPEIHPSNSFIGNMLRIELLSRAGRAQQILDESVAYLMYMAERTGTLWEHDTPKASCDHGFASHICHTLYRDVLGLAEVNPTARIVRVRLGDAKLDWCEGEIPVSAGAIKLRWEATSDSISYKVSVPQGWQVKVENNSGKKLLKAE